MQTKTNVLATLFTALCICGISLAQRGQETEITGQVVDYLARPVAGAEVAVYEGEYGPYDWCGKLVAPIGKTNQDGRFRSQVIVSSQCQTSVVARKSGLALAWDILNSNNNRSTDERGHLLLVLEKACTVTGLVVDHTGNAVSGAKVQALPWTSYMSRLRQLPMLAPQEWFTTETNSQGMFHFSQFSADVSCYFWVKAQQLNCTYKFMTSRRGRCGFEVWRSDIRLVLPRESGIRGRVVEIGTSRPVEGVSLTIRADNILNRYRPCRATTDANGVFVCAGLAEGKHIIKVSNPETETGPWIAESVELNLDHDRPVDDVKVSVERGGIIEYVVRDIDTEHPLPQMYVSASNNTFSASSITDEKGEARIHVVPGDYKLYAWGWPYIAWRADGPVAVRKGQVTRVDVAMHLDKSQMLEGTVTEANGQPVGDVLVTVHPFGDRVYTDRTGRFVAGWEKRRTKKGLFVTARDLKRSLASVVQTWELDTPLRLVLRSALTVKGKIVDPDGVGIPAARVSLHCFGGAECEVLADSEGHFEFSAIPAQHEALDYRISVHAAGFGPKIRERISIEGQPGAIANVVPLQLIPADSSISGIVVDANGLPAARVPIFLKSSGGMEQPAKSTATNEKGQFAFKGICKAPLALQADFSNSPGGMGWLSANGGDTDVKIVLGAKRVHTPSVSLIDGRLPELAGFNLKLSPTDLAGKRILVCFFDMEQRPSRNCMERLSARTRELAAKDVLILAIQASTVDQTKLNEWVKKYNIPFPIGSITADIEKTRFTWGVRSLPWLILADRKHVVCGEGFGIDELGEELTKVR